MSEWQPIETAPHVDPSEEGEEILMWVKESSCIDIGVCYTAPHEDIGLIPRPLRHGSGYTVTHWMPSPEPPREN